MDQAKINHFWSRVEKTDGCWLWQGSRNRQDYGTVTVDRRVWLTHRFAWTVTYGAIPEGLWVLHRCDVSDCVNPDHLFLGRHADNVNDMLVKGRQYGNRQRGESHPHAKLTEGQVLEIRRRHATGELLKVIALDFPIEACQVGWIVRRKNWTHI